VTTKSAVARLISPFIVSCIDSFRDAYERTGMNLAQSIVLFMVATTQRAWKRLSEL
jgi:hypothetical protein